MLGSWAKVGIAAPALLRGLSPQLVAYGIDERLYVPPPWAIDDAESPIARRAARQSGIAG